MALTLWCLHSGTCRSKGSQLFVMSKTRPGGARGKVWCWKCWTFNNSRRVNTAKYTYVVYTFIQRIRLYFPVRNCSPPWFPDRAVHQPCVHHSEPRS